MGLILAAFLSTSLLFWSDQNNASDSEALSAETMQLGSERDEPIDFTQFQDGRVLLLVHGYNNLADKAVNTYSNIFQFIADASESESYTHVIGYLWPGYDEIHEYFKAKESVEKLISRMKENLRHLSSSARTVDILAHSMGNRLILESLSKLSLEKEEESINNFFSFAAAVDDESVEKKQIYYPATQQCRKMFVFHSNNDSVLRFGYLFSEMDVALGADEDIEFSNIPNNVQFLDCTPLVDSHSGYFKEEAFPLYRFICSETMRARYGYQWAGKNLVFDSNGSLAVRSLIR